MTTTIIYNPPAPRIPATAAELLAKWDAGETIYSIRLSEEGPGDEQAIQVLAIEIVRDVLASEVSIEGMPKTSVGMWSERTVSRVSKSCGGLRSDHIVAAQWLAYKWLTIGPATLITAHFSKKIRVRNFWPQAVTA